MCHETMWHLCIPATEKILRTVLVYLFLIIGLRLAGKRELAQFNSFDLVVLITISNAVQNAIIGPENTLIGGFIGAATLLAVNEVVANISYRVPIVRKMLVGTEAVLYSKGKTNERTLRRERLTHGDLLTAARGQGAHSLEDVDEIALEPNGNIIVTLRQEAATTMVLKELRELKDMVRARG